MQHPFTSLPCSFVFCSVLLLLLCLSTVPAAEGCAKVFVKYYPSVFEEDWVSNIETYQNNICDVIGSRNQQKTWFKSWLDQSDAIEAENVVLKQHCGPRRLQAERDKEIFSVMEYRYVCPKGKSQHSNSLHGKFVNETIEPLVGFLRDPRPVCMKGKSPVKLEDKNYIMFSNLHCNAKLSSSSSSSLSTAPSLSASSSGESRGEGGGGGGSKLKPPRLIIADLGSTTFMFSLSGPSQSYLYNKYTSFGYTNLERFLAWEARPYPKTQGYFDQVPVAVMPHYQFYNVKINAEKGGRYNPLTLIKGIAKPRDFVSLKLDVDNSDIEFALIEQIIADPSVSSLIDEFFFEHHSTVKEFQWAWKEQVRGSMADGYKFFRKMRELGIRAHSWI